MTLYRNLGPICFQCETENFQIFSTEDLTLIIQFKNYFQIDLEELQNLLSVYALILKQQGLLQIYEQKNKPASILIHKTNRIKFDKISIQLLCRIIKQICLSVLHSERIIPEKVGEINKQLFFQIDGQLRYLYFPTKKICSNKQNQQSFNPNKQNFIKLIDFFKQLKDEKQLSHRLLLKKIAKCSSVEQILDETQYFMNIYYAKQNQAQLSNFTIANYTNNHEITHTTTKQLQKTKNFNKIFQQNKNEIKNDKKLMLNLQVSNNNNNKTNRSRKFQLFKNATLNPNKSVGTFTQKSSSIFSNTWRKLYKQNKSNDNTFRSNSRTLHIDLNHKNLNKSTSASLFGRDFSLSQSKKFSNSKKKNTVFNLNQNDRVQVSLHDSNLKNKSRLVSQKKSLLKQNEQNYPQQSLNQSVLLNDSIISNQKKSKNQNDSSTWMKQMVRNSLQKSKNKQFINKTDSKMTPMERSTYIDSRSKLIQKDQRKTFDTKQSRVSNLFSKKTENVGSDPMSTNTLKSSDKNLKKKCLGIQTCNDQNQLVIQIINNKSNILPQKKIQKNSNKVKQQKNQQVPDVIRQKNLSFDEEDLQSLQQIKFVQSSIQKLTVKNKHEQEKNNLERKKTSIKDLQANDQSFKKLSDQSETERIRYSNISKKNNNYNEISKNHQNDFKKQDKKNEINIVVQKQIKALFSKLSILCKQKQQIDYVGLAVVQTHDHLKVFQTIFWQLPMFFLYKKFYQKRLKLLEKINQFQSNIRKNPEYTQQFKQIQAYSCKFQEEVRIENQNIEQSLKKLLKTAKKKLKKSYPDQSEQQYIQKFLHLDYTIAYDSVLDQFISMYVCSLQQARPQFTQLTYHMVQIFEALIICKGGQISEDQKNKIFQSKSNKGLKIQLYETYYQYLLKRKQIKSILSRGAQKSQRQKQKQQDKKKVKNKNKN